MSQHYDQTILIGNLTQKPNLRRTPNDKAVTDLSLAVNRDYKDSSGEWQEDVAYIEVTLWEHKAEDAAETLTKGSWVFVSGYHNYDQWENERGETRSKLSVTANKFEHLGESKSKAEPDEVLDDVESNETEDDIPF